MRCLGSLTNYFSTFIYVGEFLSNYATSLKKVGTNLSNNVKLGQMCNLNIAQ